MKRLKLTVMALTAALMSVCLVSCEKESNPGGEDFSNEKKLTKMVMNDEQGQAREVFTFKYDSNGKLIESTASTDYGQGSASASFVWEEDLISVDYANVLSNDHTLSLSNGMVQRSSEGATFTYNDSKRITKWGTATANWDGDKVTSISDGMDRYTFTNGETCKKGYFPMISYFMGYMSPSEMMLFMAHPEIAGMRTKQLPTNVSGLSFSYEYDAEGYISKMRFNTGVALLTWK